MFPIGINFEFDSTEISLTITQLKSKLDIISSSFLAGFAGMSTKSRKSGGMKSWFIAKAEGVIPTEFYEIRAETEPRGDWNSMFGLTACLYFAVFAAFIAVYLYEGSRTHSQSKISDVDYKGEEGYTCQMLSKVTASYQYANDSNFISTILAYNLVNVKETQEHNGVNLAAAQPCNQPMTYFGGDAVPLFDKGETMGALAMFNDRVIYWINANRKEVYAYEYQGGHFYKIGGFDDLDLVTSTMAVTRLGQPLNVVRNENQTRSIYRFSGDYQPLYNTGLNYDPILVNDNHYNLYLLEQDRFVFLNITADPITESVLFQLTSGEILKSASVYHDGVNPYVYFTTTQGGNTSFYTYIDGVISHTPVVTKFYAYVLDVIVDGHNNVYYLCTMDFSSEFHFFVNATDEVVEGWFPTPTDFGISLNGERIAYTIYNNLYVNNPETNYAKKITEFPYNAVSKVTKFGAGWFTCEDQTIDYHFATNPDESEYLEHCIKNGIVGRVFFTYSYAFAPVDAAAYATAHSPDYCHAIISHVHTQIGDLPPYSCTRTVKLDFLICLGTAAADASLLMHLLIFIFAIILSKLDCHTPAQPDTPDTPDTPDKPTISEKTAITNSVPFQYVDLENPPETPEKSGNSVTFIENYF